jgi:hypothetical protein
VTQLKLYTTLGCHLCELAYQQLQQLDNKQFSIHIIDIALNDVLVERYGTAIPVIEFADQSTLSWPFELHDIETKLKLGHF